MKQKHVTTALAILAMSFASGCTDRGTVTDAPAVSGTTEETAVENPAASDPEPVQSSRSGATSEGAADLEDSGTASGASGTEYSRDIIEKKTGTGQDSPEAKSGP